MKSVVVDVTEKLESQKEKLESIKAKHQAKKKKRMSS